jgi:hypothetical protein
MTPFPLPGWTKSIFPGGRYEQLRNTAFLTDSFDDEMKILQRRPFINQLVTRFDAATDNIKKSSEEKMLMYSGHDTTLTYLLNTLGVFSMAWPLLMPAW